MSELAYPHEFLARILCSKKIGLAHVGLVGELITAEARLNMWMQVAPKEELSAAEWMELTERALECEDRCRAFWAVFDSADSDWVEREGLGELENVLRGSVALIDGLLASATSGRIGGSKR